MSDRCDGYTIHYSCILMDYFTIFRLLFTPGIQGSVYKTCYLFPYKRCTESVHSRFLHNVQRYHYQTLTLLAPFLTFLPKMQYERSFFEDGLAQLMEE